MTASPIILPYRGILPKIHPDAFVAPGAVVIGDVEIGALSSIWFGCVLRGDVNQIRIGKGSNLQDGTVVHVASPSNEKFAQGTFIGDDVTVGHMALLHACTLADSSFVGMRATAMDGAKVETHGMLAAGALLTPGKTVVAGQVWAGMPAKFLRDLTGYDREQFDLRAKQYVGHGIEYRTGQHPPA
jgi:carbonic anhydrase/acetyltransferase-like protein (isoleucine patch superfamily)